MSCTCLVVAVGMCALMDDDLDLRDVKPREVLLEWLPGAPPARRYHLSGDVPSRTLGNEDASEFEQSGIGWTEISASLRCRRCADATDRLLGAE
jgi:hypothetical protein